MPKLHEILAIERGEQAVATKLMSESLKTFNKDSLFKGMVKTLTHFNDDDTHLDGSETQTLEATVPENLHYIRGPWSQWVDTVLSKDVANMQAQADIVVDNVAIATDVPATTLLGLETKLVELRKVLDAIPTLPPGVGWERDEQLGAGAYRSIHLIETIKDVKDTEYRVVAPSTPEHPAQVAAVPITKAVGKYQTAYKSGMMSSLHKAEHLTRLDTMLKAVKKARARANEQQVDKQHIGCDIFDYIVSN